MQVSMLLFQHFPYVHGVDWHTSNYAGLSVHDNAHLRAP